MRERLLPCPFCGNANVEVCEDPESGYYCGRTAWAVHCDIVREDICNVNSKVISGCGAEGTTRETPEGAIRAWNRRIGG